MKKLLICLPSLLLICTITCMAQNNTDIDKPYIKVNGTSEKEIIPNEIYLKITLRERYEGKEKITIDSQENQLKTSISGLGIALANLSVADANAYFGKIKWRTKDVMETTNYVLKVTDAITVGRVFNELEKIQVSDADVYKVSHTKIDSLKQEVKTMAMKAARENADKMLNAVDEKRGRLLAATDVEYNNDLAQALERIPGVSVSASRLERDKSEYVGYNNGNQLEYRKIKLQATVIVKYEIK